MPLGIYTLSVLVILSVTLSVLATLSVTLSVLATLLVTLSVLATLLVSHPVRTRHLVRLVRTRHPVYIVGYSVRRKEQKTCMVSRSIRSFLRLVQRRLVSKGVLAGTETQR